jgi:hypothetical protein
MRSITGLTVVESRIIDSGDPRDSVTPAPNARGAPHLDSTVHEGQQVRGDQLIEMPRGLRGAEPASDGECGQDAAAPSILDLGAQAPRGTKVARPAAPTVRAMQRFEHAARRHPLLEGVCELLRGQSGGCIPRGRGVMG